MKAQDLLEVIHQLTPEQLTEIQDVIANAKPEVAELIHTATKTLHGMSQMGRLRSNNPGVPLDQYGRLMMCSSCGTKDNIHRDLGSGGPYRCSSYDCVMF